MAKKVELFFSALLLLLSSADLMITSKIVRQTKKTRRKGKAKAKISVKLVDPGEDDKEKVLDPNALKLQLIWDYPEPPKDPEEVKEERTRLRAIARRITAFNMQADSDDAMEHFGTPGTFMSLVGPNPVLVRTRIALFRFRARPRARELKLNPDVPKPKKKRTALDPESQRYHSKLLEKAHATISRKVAELEKKLKERVLLVAKQKRTKQKKPKRESFRKSSEQRREQLAAIQRFARHRRLTRTKPAKVVSQINDSRLIVRTFSKPPPRQRLTRRDAADGKTRVIQTRVALPSTFKARKFSDF